MEFQELNDFIESSPLKKQLLECSFVFANNKRPELNKVLNGLSAAYKYLDIQIKGWEKKYQGTNTFLVQFRTPYQLNLGMINSLIHEVKLNSNVNVQSRWNQLIANQNGNFVPFELPEIDFLIDLDKNLPEFFNGAYNYFFNFDKPLQDLMPNKNYLTGALLALMHAHKDKLPISNWLDSDIKRITTVKEKYFDYLSEIESQKLSFFEKFKKEHLGLQETLQTEAIERKKGYDTWYEKTTKEHQEFFNTSKNEINQIHSVYGELLKLKEPAEYWAKRAQELKKQGNKNLCWFIIAVAITAISLFFLLYISPDDMLESFFANNKSRAIRWSIVFITFVSIMFIAIRTLGRMMFSSFHLARDAEERHQLTYLYLALKKDSAVDDKDRQLILQSLFSRADTGLLKDEAGPTMPGIEKVITNN